MKVNKFVVGRGNIPDWFNEKCKQNRAKLNFDDDGELINISVFTPTKLMIANVGDLIILDKHGMSVVKNKNTEVKIDVKKDEAED